MKYVMILCALLLVNCGRVEPQKGDPGPAGQSIVGPQGAPGVDSVEVEPAPFCPNLPGAYPESGIEIGGVIYAVYYAPPHVSLVALTAGNYVTTDGRNCYFTVTSDGHVINQTGGD